ncbi:tetratricopeptide repeat-containing sulfotransferase family protein [Haloferula sp. BvORR071]|uniref:tetratricopeptide repeat-containing sulfotransferase family protein n=1 Tax=Haloferula sp. BvORR071 TaxID=1396141 RepID=UPI0009DEBABA|nr:tetratricopeptide repeat-containing sulfotransferase family protein [Haloferula sp. BvORR071]
MSADRAKLLSSPREAARWREAQEHLLRGRHAAAQKQYRGLVRDYPGVAELWFELGNSAAGELDFPAANQAYSRARELAGDNAALLSLLGQQYQTLRQADDARRCYEQAAGVAPRSIDSRINLAVWLEKERRVEEAWDQTQAALEIDPRDDQARYFQAFLLHRRHQNEEAAEELRNLIKGGPRYPYVKYASRHLLGVVCDQLGDFDEAMRWLLEAKQEIRTLTDTKVLERGYDEGVRLRHRLLDSFKPDAIRRWREGTPEGDGPRLAFLGGHPRSGTTLLEQVLDANPDLLAFDEPVAFNQEITSRIPLASTQGDALFRQLDLLPPAKLGEMRQRYLKSLLREAGELEGSPVLLDKNPSPTASLGIWLRVFPAMKVIIALRDPRDVITSCFFMNVMLNSTNVNFLSLERTVKHYRDLMDIWLRLREFEGFDWIESRYEDLVGDLDKEGRRVTEFLNLDWHAGQSQFHETASQKLLYAPTYHDVTQKVHRRAVGRWENYRKYLEPLLPALDTYCRAFGYSP